jgi:magnesium transporter
MLYRLLPKEQASRVFEELHPVLQKDLISSLQDEEVAVAFADLEPDDRVALLEELPASVATRLMRGLSAEQRDLTADILGYPKNSIGRRMSPEVVSLHPEVDVRWALSDVNRLLDYAETVYTLPVTDQERVLVGVVSLRDLMKASSGATVGDIMQPAERAHATDPAEEAARLCASRKLLALPVVDSESRLVGILTVDDALTILEDADSEDQARISGSGTLRQPYLSTSVATLVRSRVVWLLVLAIGAALTVQVLDVFESTLAEIAKIVAREFQVGLSLGLILGGVGFAITSVIFEPSIGAVIGLTLLSVCTMAATVGGVMPLLAKSVGADPAVFSNPFITTFVDATGLVVYFLIAKAVLHI